MTDTGLTSGTSDRPVLVAMLTFKRPADLAEALPAVTAQLASVPGSQLLVVDNDPAGSAGEVVRAAAGVRYVLESEPGIAAARNRALDEATEDTLLVFIDDDETPSEGWLRGLVGTWRETGAAAVAGAVVSEYDEEPGEWVAAGRFFDRRRLPTGTAIEVAATNNLLLDMRRVRALGLRFDLRFGISGGSDTLFTRRLTGAGGRMVWNDEAVVVDRVPASRVTREWVLRRAFRSGNSWTRTSLALAGSPAARVRVRIRAVLTGLVRIAGGAAAALLGLVTGRLPRRVRGVRTIVRGAGMLAGAWGVHYREYAAQHATGPQASSGAAA
ncbi:glycosyltransferase [Nakamurella sp. YIM 132087]|uniref:Glycosyltransferase n=1 Tax=Nakamurella alba TaxID=2665158 RepID=A0A7K1FF93_9ACTN|nr:glycosyltransferase [Nakamurella alba]MTD12746.1 glycosyltransferase [Nakamurella alba]